MLIMFFINRYSYGGSRRRLAYPAATNNNFESKQVVALSARPKTQ
jgi:hypothetical protein